MNRRRIHDLKTWPEHFSDVANGRKTHEVRVFDRDYQVGDVLLLREYSRETEAYSGRRSYVEVTCITPPGFMAPHAPEWGVMSIRRLASWQCSGCKLLFLGRYQQFCPNCKREAYWSGSASPTAVHFDEVLGG